MSMTKSMFDSTLYSPSTFRLVLDIKDNPNPKYDIKPLGSDLGPSIYIRNLPLVMTNINIFQTESELKQLDVPIFLNTGKYPKMFVYLCN